MRNAHPPESPLNGGMNLTIPLLGGVPAFAAGRVLLLNIGCLKVWFFKIQINFFNQEMSIYPFASKAKKLNSEFSQNLYKN